MGIPGFNIWFAKNNQEAYVPLCEIQVDHVYIDLNAIMHNALRTGRTWEKFHKKLHAKLNNLLEVSNPQKSVMLAVDGPAPLAKLLTQRKRRKAKNRTSAKGGVKAKQISSNAITPGTRFMLDATLSLTQWAHSKLQTNKWSHLQFELSDGTVMGEGEVKILGRLARPWHQPHPDDTHLIVGDDADLILMACVSWRDHLYVANTSVTEEKNLHKNTPLFSVDLFHDQLLQTALHKSHTALSVSDATKLLGLKVDLTLMAILASGNDYLPGMGLINLDSTWKAYRRKRCSAHTVGFHLTHVDPDTCQTSIHLANLATLLKETAGNAMPKFTPQPARGASATIATATQVQHTTFHSGDSGSAGGDEDVCMGGGEDDDLSDADLGSEQEDLSETMSEGLASVEADMEDEEEAAGMEVEVPSAVAGPSGVNPHLEQYLYGLLWVLDMYVTGACPDYRFTYDRPAPSIHRFVRYIQDKAATTPQVSLAHWGAVPEAHKVPLPPVGCAVAMLPAESEDLLPEPAQPLLRAENSPLAELNAECATCTDLNTRTTIALKERKAAEHRVESLQVEISTLDTHGDPKDPAYKKQKKQLLQDLQAAEHEYENKVQVHRQLANALQAHKKGDHKPQPFPLASVIEAVESIPNIAISQAERPLLRFGKAVVLGRPRGHLKGGRRLAPPPAPFVNSRSYSTTAVMSWEIQEPQGHTQPAQLQPDTQFASQLHTEYISAPEGLELLPAEQPRSEHQQHQHQQPHYQQQQEYNRQYQPRPGSGGFGRWNGQEEAASGQGIGGRGRGRGPPMGADGRGQGRGRWSGRGPAGGAGPTAPRPIVPQPAYSQRRVDTNFSFRSGSASGAPGQQQQLWRGPPQEAAGSPSTQHVDKRSRRMSGGPGRGPGAGVPGRGGGGPAGGAGAQGPVPMAPPPMPSAALLQAARQSGSGVGGPRGPRPWP